MKIIRSMGGTNWGLKPFQVWECILGFPSRSKWRLESPLNSSELSPG